MASQLNVMVGGEAGQGVQSVGFILAKTLARSGYSIFADQDYESRIRGGHNFYRVRATDSEIGAISESLDILIAINKETIDLHQKDVAAAGAIIFDNEKIRDVSSQNSLGLPLEKLALENAGDKVMANIVALGAALGLARYDMANTERVLREFFKSGDVSENNIKAVRSGCKYVQDNYHGGFDHFLPPITERKRLLLNGNEAIALGAIAAGCKFMAAYPMTPVTGIMEYLAAKADEFGIAVVPAEDEISAINMTIGAAYAGARAMTATSGSGFCLMTEGLGLAAITETPIVIVNGQRPGPAIGLPTRTEQGDLQFVLYAHQGDFPRVVLAPSTVDDCFWLTVKAFNLADKYQVPVIILTDHHLASSYATTEKFNLSKVTIDKGSLHSEKPGEAYQRYKITASGISPRAFPGQGKSLVVADSDEHNEDGHMIEDAATRQAMMDKRMRKLVALSREISPPQLYGPARADILLIGWGSTCGAIKEATDILQKDGASVASLHFSELYPFPATAVDSRLGKYKKSFVIENNASGQFARLIRAETGKKHGTILKYDGRPFTPAEIVQRVRKEAR